VHEAANSNKKAVELILKYRKDDVDLDSYRAGGRTARECIHSKYPELMPLLPKYHIKSHSLDCQNQLLLALQKRQLHIFHDILRQVDEDGKSRVDPNYCYGRPHFATCLEIACKEEDCAEYAKELLGAGVNQNSVNPRNKQTALQVALEKRYVEGLCVLLEDRRMNINAVYDEEKQVIAELINQKIAGLVRQTNNEKAIQKLESILNTLTPEYQNIKPRYRSEIEQTLFQHLYERRYEDFKNKFIKQYKDSDNGFLHTFAVRYILQDGGYCTTASGKWC
jgi:hypothetical protein